MTHEDTGLSFLLCLQVTHERSDSGQREEEEEMIFRQKEEKEGRREVGILRDAFYWGEEDVQEDCFNQKTQH